METLVLENLQLTDQPLNKQIKFDFDMKKMKKSLVFKLDYYWDFVAARHHSKSGEDCLLQNLEISLKDLGVGWDREDG